MRFLPVMDAQTDIAELFLAIFANRNNARERAEMLIARLESSPDWRPEEISELRQIISERLGEPVSRQGVCAVLVRQCQGE